MNRRREDGTSDTCTYHHARIIMLGSPRNILELMMDFSCGAASITGEH